MADNDCWGAFGSDSDSDDDEGGIRSNEHHGHAHDPFEPAADATALAITQHFVSLTKSSGVLPKDRVVAIGNYLDDDDEQMERWQDMLVKRVGGRGMKVVCGSESLNDDFLCDGAILLRKDVGFVKSSCIKRSLLPGGFLWLVVPPLNRSGIDIGLEMKLEGFAHATWDVDGASVIYASSECQVISLQKRACTINSWSCRWMDKGHKIPEQVRTRMASNYILVTENETYLQYERKVACAVTVSPSVAERTKENIAPNSLEKPVYSTILNDASVQRATEILREHGFVVIKGLLPPSQTIPWGEAVLSDFEAAVSRLKCHPTRPVDLLHPRVGDDESTAEPLSYKELAMREDLRVDLRSGPEMERLRCSENGAAIRHMEGQLEENSNDGPTIINADNTGTATNWRFHPSILAVIKALFNPRDETLYKGNFGRWNFSGAGRGPDGSPQPFRLGQIGSVLSCPGSADQAIHADTPHLFEHLDCLSCHYCNVFTPGYKVDQPDNDFYRNVLDGDGVWTGNSTVGGTALVNGSHKLSVTTQLLADGEADMNVDENGSENDASLRRQLLQLQTIRPALDTGDVLIFDCRTIHYGLANTSQGDTTGKDMNAGRRPMLYLNVSSAWFHDPKNWDDRERIFE